MVQLSVAREGMEAHQAGTQLLKGQFAINITFQSSYLSMSQVILDQHNEISNEELATCTRVLPMLELLMSEWEELIENKEYELVHVALQAGISLLEKYYHHADDTDVYFIAHGMQQHYFY